MKEKTTAVFVVGARVCGWDGIEPMPEGGAADGVCKPLLHMLTQQWGEIKDERQRLERWKESLDDKSGELRNAKMIADSLAEELRGKCEQASEEIAALKASLADARREAERAEAASNLQRASDSAKLAAAVTEAERAEVEAQHALELSLIHI